jgi:hypothetical protein
MAAEYGAAGREWHLSWPRRAMVNRNHGHDRQENPSGPFAGEPDGLTDYFAPVTRTA